MSKNKWKSKIAQSSAQRRHKISRKTKKTTSNALPSHDKIQNFPTIFFWIHKNGEFLYFSENHEKVLFFHCFLTLWQALDHNKYSAPNVSVSQWKRFGAKVLWVMGNGYYNNNRKRDFHDAYKPLIFSHILGLLVTPCTPCIPRKSKWWQAKRMCNIF